MKDILWKRACAIGGVIGVAFIVAMYVLFAAVDLVYVVDGREAYRQEDVRVITKIADPTENMSEEFLADGDSVRFTYQSGNNTKTLDTENLSELKGEIAKTVAKNLFTFQWEEQNYVIEFTSK